MDIGILQINFFSDGYVMDDMLPTGVICTAGIVTALLLKNLWKGHLFPSETYCIMTVVRPIVV